MRGGELLGAFPKAQEKLGSKTKTMAKSRPSRPGPVIDRDKRNEVRQRPVNDAVAGSTIITEECNPSKELDRTGVISHGLKWTASWSLRLIVIVAAIYVILKVAGMFWSAFLPIAAALLVTTVLWPPVRWMQSHDVPPALAAACGLLGAFVIVGGIIAAMAPSVNSQWGDLTDQAIRGVQQVQDWLQIGPLHVKPTQIDNATKTITEKLQSSGDTIASTALSGISLAGKVLIDVVIALILTFFFLKDGPRFLPWLRASVGRGAETHLTEALTRIWHTLSAFICTQAIVSAVDSICIGIGLLILGVPLAAPLVVLTFFGGFIPIIGAFTAGTLAVLVALVTVGVTKAIIVLIIIVLVQQLEGHILQPLLQSKSMSLYPAIVLLVIAFGSDKYGIIGAFFAVPVAATIAVMWRYLSEQIDLRTGDASVANSESVTLEGPPRRRGY